MLQPKRNPRNIRADPLFLERMMEIKIGIDTKYHEKWSDRKITRFIAENLDWGTLFSPLQEKPIRNKRKDGVYGIGEEFNIFK